VCILFSNCIYRRDRINFHYAVETLLQLTDITMKKFKKKYILSRPWRGRPSAARAGCSLGIIFSHTQPRRHKICLIIAVGTSIFI